jgi:Response regulators consisting of a CheY-like receiver domain and a winged-helix DNA-binding domain
MPLILVADDDRMISLLVCAILRRQGWEVDATFDVTQTVARANREPLPDAIVLDMNLGDGTARDVVGALRATPATTELPVILLTGAGEEQLRVVSASASIAAVLSKPVEPDAIVSAVQRVLGRTGEPKG